MKPRDFLNFFKTKSGRLVLFVVVFGGGLLVFSALRGRSGRDDDMDVRVSRSQTNATDKPQVVQTGKSEVGIIAYGSSHWAMVEARDQLRDEYNVETDYLRIRAYPFNRDVHEFVASHQRVYVVDQNRDGQMLSLLKLDVDPHYAPRLRSVRHYNGLPVDARSITDEIISQEGK